ncbi:hypothetical protein L1987_41790 [Smallanthus sonchifolius]|uniref:Uncharacterized protein n=1 Tax=Smallanthus sonchifolius TaxID=185202 RepID=A0ACB9GXC5_9ASTR|nr:hypothetical protein L1987_41790 [Smallanthus sonchifolius]
MHCLVISPTYIWKLRALYVFHKVIHLLRYLIVLFLSIRLLWVLSTCKAIIINGACKPKIPFALYSSEIRPDWPLGFPL